MKTFLLGLLCVALLATSAFADSWLPPRVAHYASPNGQWRLTVYPRGLTSQLDYFKDKVDGKPNAGAIPGDTQASPIGHMERKQAGRWATVWKAPLVNEVSPVDAVVSDAGVAVTFDNWHSVGWGDDAVVIYAADGARVRAFGLSAFLPEHYIRALPHSVSSIDWRREPRIDEARRQLVIPVVIPALHDDTGEPPSERHLEVRFLLADGSLVPLAAAAWEQANAAAVQADAERRREREAARQRFISPLSAPVGGDTRQWHDYLTEAFFRVDSDWEEGYPATKVVPLPGEPRAGQLTRYLGDALSDDVHDNTVVMVASPSQDVLVQALRQQAKRVKPGGLAKARVYVAADAAHMPAVRAALAHTGASVLQLDIDVPIPQRKQRLERYLKNTAQ